MLVDECEGVIRHLAQRFAQSWSGVWQDLVQEGRLAVLEHQRDYAAEKGLPTSYFYPIVRERMQAYLAAMIPALPVSPWVMREALKTHTLSFARSLDELRENGFDIAQQPESDYCAPHDSETVIESAMSRLHPTMQLLLQERYCRTVQTTYAELARQLNTEPHHVQSMEKQALLALKYELLYQLRQEQPAVFAAMPFETEQLPLFGESDFDAAQEGHHERQNTA